MFFYLFSLQPSSPAWGKEFSCCSNLHPIHPFACRSAAQPERDHSRYQSVDMIKRTERKKKVNQSPWRRYKTLGYQPGPSNILSTPTRIFIYPPSVSCPPFLKKCHFLFRCTLLRFPPHSPRVSFASLSSAYFPFLCLIIRFGTLNYFTHDFSFLWHRFLFVISNYFSTKFVLNLEGVIFSSPSY